MTKSPEPEFEYREKTGGRTMTAIKARSKKRRMYLELGTADGDLRIDEEVLPTIADADLTELGISREELHRCFKEGRRLMRGYTDRDRVRPVADQRRDGTWEVNRVWYSPLNDPLNSQSGSTRTKSSMAATVTKQRRKSATNSLKGNQP
jgi:hypothetical protein